MGDYANLTIDQTISSWDGSSGAGWGEPPTLFKKVIECRRCGYPVLYWAKHNGKWVLHHYAKIGNKPPSFVRHRCGLQSTGEPSAKWPFPPTQGHQP